MPFGFAKKFLDAGKRAVNKDLLEAICASSLLVAAADGRIDRDEVDQLKVSLAGNPNLAAFSPADINAVIARYASAIEGGFRSAKLQMRKEIGDISAPEQAETVFAVSLDVADQGGIDAKELRVLHEIAGWLGVNPAEFDLPNPPAAA